MSKFIYTKKYRKALEKVTPSEAITRSALTSTTQVWASETTTLSSR
jgi:hypothetical protein